MTHTPESRTIDVVVRTTIYREGGFTVEELADAASVSAPTLQRLIRLGLIEPDTATADRFTPATAARLVRMVRLHRQLQVGLSGAAVIVDLLERLERMEAELDRLRSER